MNSSSREPDFEAQPENRLPDRAAPALRKSEATGSKLSPAPPESSSELPMRGEIFDVELDENGRIEGESPKRKGAGAWFFAGLAALFCAYNIGAYVGQKSKTPAPLGPFTTQNEKLKPLRLHLAGKVKKPGVYTLPGGARVEDALKKAGGALPDADLSALNLADWAVDGSKIEIPARQVRKNEPTPTPIVIVKEVFVTPPQNAPDSIPPAAPVASDIAVPDSVSKTSPEKPKTRAKTSSGGKTSESALAALRRNPVDLNRAGVEQLSVLPGVGPKMAERIIAYRTENGGFKSVADLDNVKGVGEKRMEILKDLVKVK